MHRTIPIRPKLPVGVIASCTANCGISMHNALSGIGCYVRGMVNPESEETTDRLAERFLAKYAPEDGEDALILDMFKLVIEMARDVKMARMFGTEWEPPEPFRRKPTK